ncbi:iron chelate uptake ABC transporter family permease subunit [Crossiella sp. SN42]|uniref:FecCD family ABC transporter permease n=1 Tax=Crossiella sp. SN42 TaxID=2944808 RepID=UPI00207D4893|nr:iron chelate uptake ABC transporter family permease subunit [Crossiella sp. SN42]MCO1582381.1 iron chelate uptake ABC transporter family permease subunit [Crossiella sp. SN42]
MTRVQERTTPIRGRVLRVHRGWLSLRLDPRALTVCLLLALGAATAGVFGMTTGDFPLTPGEVVNVLLGLGDGPTEFIVLTLRLPRVVAGLVIGAALAVSGAVLQSLTRNPLGSPDFLGFTHGSATGAIVVIVWYQGSMAEISLGALAGGTLTMVLTYLLAFSRGVQGFRLVLVGIGVSSLLIAVNLYLVTQANIYDALQAQAWQTGSLNGRTWGHLLPLGAAMALLLPLALHYGRRLAVLEMGDEAAAALGVRVEPTRLVLIAISVTLCSLATAAAGPIAFLALAAPQLARRLTGATGPNLAASALMGSLLLVVSDLAVQRIFAPVQLPVGIVTGAIGGLYLVWLLAHEWRRGR